MLATRPYINEIQTFEKTFNYFTRGAFSIPNHVCHEWLSAGREAIKEKREKKKKKKIEKSKKNEKYRGEQGWRVRIESKDGVLVRKN